MFAWPCAGFYFQNKQHKIMILAITGILAALVIFNMIRAREAVQLANTSLNLCLTENTTGLSNSPVVRQKALFPGAVQEITLESTPTAS